MQVQAANVDLAIHSLGWKAFQDLCVQVCAETFGATVAVYREAQDGGQDAVLRVSAAGSARGSVEATIQCKFCSKADRRLRATDVDAELATVRQLVSAGRAHTYYFITSMGVDAPVAAKIRDKLSEAGVSDPYVHGREWLTKQIRSSARLRALVPRVYGLGDLSTILDERCVHQTQILLGHLQPGLRVYVPTAAHRAAVRILEEHKIVLLLGPPASGKSMLAAILATTAIDGNKHQCLKCDGPLELTNRWNPHERNRLYWVDDAFGANQLRSESVDSWIAAMPKLKAALELGNRFILTSRTHIWNDAKSKLGTRNLPVLADAKAVVNLGTLSRDEREQIIYNHLKAGNQPTAWKCAIKPYLPDLVEKSEVLPEIARRLGDAHHTQALKRLPADLIKFVGEPAEFLVQTIKELDDAQQAALTLVFLRQGKLPVLDIADESASLVANKYGVLVPAIAKALPKLDGSFIALRREDDRDVWGFVHPTFTDAISSILSAQPDLVELYVKGAKLETLLAEVVCEGAVSIQDAVVIPASASRDLVARLKTVPDEQAMNRSLFEFLARRASDEVLQGVIAANPGLARRVARRSWRIASDPRIHCLARVHRLHLLPQEIRLEEAEKLESGAIEDLDVSFLDNDEILGLLEPIQLLRLGVQLVDALSGAVPSRISEISRNVDLDYDVSNQFDEVRDFVEQLKDVFPREEAVQDRLEALGVDIDNAVEELSQQQNLGGDDGNWSNVSPAEALGASKGRSTFSDVDE